MRCVVHGDDFTFSGSDDSLDWVQSQMEKPFLCKGEGRLGDGPTDLRQARVPNTVVTWESWGIKYEPDPRHAEILIRELEVQDKERVVSPGVKWRAEDVEAAVALGKEEASRYRALAARANYLGLDRVDNSICSEGVLLENTGA